MIDQVLGEAGLKRETVDLVICHQASHPGVEHVRRLMGGDPARVIDRFGVLATRSPHHCRAYSLTRTRRGELRRARPFCCSALPPASAQLRWCYAREGQTRPCDRRDGRAWARPLCGATRRGLCRSGDGRSDGAGRASHSDGRGVRTRGPSQGGSRHAFDRHRRRVSRCGAVEPVGTAGGLPAHQCRRHQEPARGCTKGRRKRISCLCPRPPSMRR